MAQPKKESYTECPKCGETVGEVVIIHYMYLKLIEPFWGGEPYWECPEGHKVAAPPVKVAAPPQPAA